VERPAPGQLRGRPLILSGEDQGIRTQEDEAGVFRKIRTIPYNTEQAREWLTVGEKIRMAKYDVETMKRSRDYLLKFETFAKAWPFENPTDGELLTAFAGFLHAKQNQAPGTTLPSTVSNYLWHLAKGVEYFRGERWDNNLIYIQIQRGLRSQYQPTTKAVPLRLRATLNLVRQGRLSLPARALVAALWLSAQRPGNLLALTRENIVDDGTDLSVWFTTKRKGKNLVERLLPPVQIWTAGPLTDVVREHFSINRRRHLIFEESDHRELRAHLREIIVTEERPPVSAVKWRAYYTPYSIKRGALQHLAAWGKDLAAISCLSLHHRLDTLAIYIGSFLNAKTTETRELTRMLMLEPPVVPCEFPLPRVQLTNSRKENVQQTTPRGRTEQTVQTTQGQDRDASPEPTIPPQIEQPPPRPRRSRMMVGLVDPLIETIRETTPEIPQRGARTRSQRGKH
jgi:integrase